MKRFLEKDFWLIFLLGITSGLPVALIMGTLANRMTILGVDKTSIGLFALTGLPYSFKFLWAYIIDYKSVPLIGKYTGRDKSWIVLTTTILVFLIIALGVINPQTHLLALAIICLAISFTSATLDIAIDSYRIKLFSNNKFDNQNLKQTNERMTLASGFYIYGYRIGALVSGGGALYLGTFLDWNIVCIICSMFMLVSFIVVFFGKKVSDLEHKQQQSLAKTFELMVLAPIKSIMLTPNIFFLILFVMTFKLPDAFLGNMANSFYVNIGFSNLEIASVIKTYGLVMTLLGTFLGGVLVNKANYYFSLFISIVLQSLSNLFYLLLIKYGANVEVLTLVITIENIMGALSGVIMIGFISNLCKIQYSAMHYAILSSIATLGRTSIASSAGKYVDLYGYSSLFICSALMGIIPLLLIRKIKTSFNK
jgi:PAT family beta-lactamase induction signal transducer AmpG